MDGRIVQWIESKYAALGSALSERGRRRWAAVEAVSLGRGGITVVSAATGLAHSTIRRGIRELDTDSLPVERQRRKGGGRKRVEMVDTGVQAALEHLVEPDSRGDP